MKRRRRSYFPPGMYVLVVAMLVVTAIIITALLPHSQTLLYAKAYTSKAYSGILIRTEETVDLSGYEKVDYAGAVEGSHLVKDAVFATAYKTGYVKNTLATLASTEESIVTYQNGTMLTDRDDSTLTGFDFNISVIVGKMAANGAEYAVLHQQLLDAISKRAVYVKETFGSNTYLDQLYNDEKTLLNSLSTWCETLQTDSDCYLSFYDDGLGKTITFQAVSAMTPTQFRKVTGTEPTEKANCIRLVTEETWYAAVLTDSTAGYNQGDSYPVYIGASETPETGQLVNIRTDKKGTVLIFSFTTNVKNYLSQRMVEIHVGQRYEGLTVKRSYLHNNQIILRDKNGKKAIDVTVLHDDGKNIIFSSDSLTEGQKVFNK